jgi:hypothetical protein
MRIRLFILAALILLSLLTLQAFSQTTSQPISGYDEISGNFIVGGGSLSQQAQAARAAEMGQLGKETPSDSSRSELSSGTGTPQQTRSEVLNQTVTTQQSATNATAPAQPETPTQQAVISGSWSLELNDSTPHMTSLTIFQNGDTVYGNGNINLDANTTITAAASGTVTGDKVDLDIVSLGKASLYRVVMTVKGDSATGSYTAFRPGAGSTTGTINGVRAVPSS